MQAIVDLICDVERYAEEAPETCVGRDLADRIITALAEADYVIVPREPTNEMITQADEKLRALPEMQRVVEGPERLNTLRKAYRFMIEAAHDEG